MIDRLTRVECIVLYVIHFDLSLDIPHNYVTSLIKKAFQGLYFDVICLISRKDT